MLCGLDSLWIWTIDKYLARAPVNAPFSSYFIKVSGNHKVSQIDAEIKILKMECTGMETQLRNIGNTYTQLLVGEKRIWRNLDKEGMKMRAKSPDFDNNFMNALIARKKEMDMRKGRLAILRRRIQADENVKGNILAATSMINTNTNSVDLEGFFGAINNINESSVPLMGDQEMGENQLDFMLKMTNTGNASSSGTEIDESFKTEIVNMLMADKPIESTTQYDSFSVYDKDETFTSSTRQSDRYEGAAIMSSEMDSMMNY